VPTVDEARTILDKPPLGRAKLMEFDFVELIPLTPLHMLLSEGWANAAKQPAVAIARIREASDSFGPVRDTEARDNRTPPLESGLTRPGNACFSAFWAHLKVEAHSGPFAFEQPILCHLRSGLDLLPALWAAATLGKRDFRQLLSSSRQS
jgi:hypothetical protein